MLRLLWVSCLWCLFSCRWFFFKLISESSASLWCFRLCRFLSSGVHTWSSHQSYKGSKSPFWCKSQSRTIAATQKDEISFILSLRSKCLTQVLEKSRNQVWHLLERLLKTDQTSISNSCRYIVYGSWNQRTESTSFCLAQEHEEIVRYQLDSQHLIWWY